MGIGYQVAALHRLTYWDMSALHARPIVKGENPALDVVADAIGARVTADGPVRVRSPTTQSMLAWRQRIASQYRDQLDEELTGVILRLAKVATEKHLPLWTTG